eukprot:TRINITY_DN21485_c0_g1_i1.p1 TRINITY_DN21485_c0_g1~~TRINITY_DN21485_c0_g1_i1.p1  ORF type:complete len:532 (+),score=37.44 TRINITY_DN21485_c0_g1_i1:56-1597(+)
MAPTRIQWYGQRELEMQNLRDSLSKMTKIRNQKSELSFEPCKPILKMTGKIADEEPHEYSNIFRKQSSGSPLSSLRRAVVGELQRISIETSTQCTASQVAAHAVKSRTWVFSIRGQPPPQAQSTNSLPELSADMDSFAADEGEQHGVINEQFDWREGRNGGNEATIIESCDRTNSTIAPRRLVSNANSQGSTSMPPGIKLDAAQMGVYSNEPPRVNGTWAPPHLAPSQRFEFQQTAPQAAQSHSPVSSNFDNRFYQNPVPWTMAQTCPELPVFHELVPTSPKWDFENPSNPGTPTSSGINTRTHGAQGHVWSHGDGSTNVAQPGTPTSSGINTRTHGAQGHVWSHGDGSTNVAQPGTYHFSGAQPEWQSRGAPTAVRTFPELPNFDCQLGPGTARDEFSDVFEANMCGRPSPGYPCNRVRAPNQLPPTKFDRLVNSCASSSSLYRQCGYSLGTLSRGIEHGNPRAGAMLRARNGQARVCQAPPGLSQPGGSRADANMSLINPEDDGTAVRFRF